MAQRDPGNSLRALVLLSAIFFLLSALVVPGYCESNAAGHQCRLCQAAHDLVSLAPPDVLTIDPLLKLDSPQPDSSLQAAGSQGSPRLPIRAPPAF